MVGKTAAASHHATGSGLKGGRLLALLLLSTVLGGVPPFGGYEAHAQQAANEAVSFQIPAQPLSSAIDAFIRQSGWQISYSSALVRGKTSPGVSGNLAPGAALQRLVAGTGISVSIGAPGSAALIDPAGAAVDLSDDGSIMLGTIVIQGSGATTEGTGSYTTGEASGSTGLPLSIRETPQSVTVVTDQRMKDQGIRSVMDALNNTTGVVSTTSETDRGNTYSRGYGIGTYIVDGIAVNSTNADYFTGVWLNSSSTLYDRVEVVRGATGLLTGTGEPGGAFRLERKQATSREVTGSAELRFGTWNRVGGGIDISTPLNAEGTVRGRFVFDASSENSWRDRYHVNRQTWYGTIAADLTPDTTVTFSLEHKSSDPKGSEYRGWPIYFSNGEPTDLPRSFSSAPSWASWATKQTLATAKVDHDFGSGWTASATLSGVWFESDGKAIGCFLCSIDQSTGLGMAAYPFHSVVNNRQIALDATLSGPVEFFGRTHDLYFGARGSRLWSKSGGSTANPSYIDYGSIYDWNGSIAEPEWGNFTETDWSVAQTQYSAFGSARISIADPMNLIIGGRYTSWKADVRHFEQLTPYVGLTYDLNRDISVYASYTGIFTPQALRDRNGAYLDPIEGTSKEVGVKAEFFDGRLNGSLSYYRISRDNVPVWDGGNLVPGTTDYAYYTTKGVQSKGVEFEIAGEIRPGWNLSFGATAGKVTSADGTKTEGSIPTRTVKLFTTYNLPDQYSNWTVGGGLRWQNSTWHDLSLASGTVRKDVPGFAVVDVMARYDFNDTWSAQLNVNNLFDKNYYTISGGDSLKSYGAPRNVMLTLVSRF